MRLSQKIIDAMRENCSLEDFQLFKQALTEENLNLQITISRKLESIAQIVGEKLTREDLLPFIQLHSIDLHNEILLNLAHQLRGFIPLVGGVEHAKIVFEILGKLCINDENVVREKAVESLIFIQQTLDTAQTEEFMLPLIDVLIKDDWFASKCSAVMLFSSIYPKLSNEKKPELRNTFIHLIQDDSPMVRKATATACVSFVEVVENDFLRSEFILILRDIAQDPLDLVRGIVIDIATALIKRLGQNGLDESVFKTIETACDDSSWRIRQRLASSLASLQEKIPHAKYRGKLLALFQKLSNDINAEVRVFIANNLFAYCDHLRTSYRSQTGGDDNFEPVFVQSFMPLIQRLALDENKDVRLALSSNMLPLRKILSEKCFSDTIVEFLLEALNKEESTDIHTNFLLVLSSLSESVDFSQSLEAIKNAVKTVLDRSQHRWRTRRSILVTVVDVSKYCTAEYFAANFKEMYVCLIQDPVFAVRRSAALVLPLLAKHYGMKWASEHLIPCFTRFAKDSRYLYRFIPLYGINEFVNSHLCKENSFLNGFQIFVPGNKNALLSLAKIHKLNDVIQKKLNGNFVLTLIKSLARPIMHESSCDIYYEKDFDKLDGISLFSLEEKDFNQNDHYPYLQGVLSDINNTYLTIIETMYYDPSENVQTRAIGTLAEITKFVDKINEELSAKWVQKSLKLLDKQEMLKIEEEYTGEFKESNIDTLEEIDTTLMEGPLSEAVDLSLERSEIQKEIDDILDELIPKVDEGDPKKPESGEA